MKATMNMKEANLVRLILFLLPMILYWIILFSPIPYSFTVHIHFDSVALFLSVMALYFLAHSFRGRLGAWMPLMLTMILFSLALSYLWTSGFSDNSIIGGLLPYKDGQQYYTGANLLQNGLPLVGVSQAKRPLFPGFLTALLWLTNGNLQIALALEVQAVALSIYFAVQQFRNSFGSLAASLFATLLFLYIQSSSGTAVSEILGVLTGCLGFSVIWWAAKEQDWSKLLLGMVVLMVAVSARAGAFFIFPMLALWIGWIFRGAHRFSFQRALYATIVIAVGFFIVNSIYARLLGIPPGLSFGNFSYSLYGQVRGGTGWHSAIEDLGSQNPAVVYRASLNFFLKHPLSIFIGFAKAYRDFFLPGSQGIFSFYGWDNWWNLLPWLVTSLLLIVGIVYLLRNLRSNIPSLLLAGFLGIFLSIPFLPPIDGGTRFYAGTIPFFFALPAVGLSRLIKANSFEDSFQSKWATVISYSSIMVLAVILILPPLIYATGKKTAYEAPACAQGQEAFAIETHAGMYFDVIKDGSPCGMLPNVCVSDFEKNNPEKSVDEFYAIIFRLLGEESSGARIIPGLDLLTNKFHYFYVSLDKLPTREQPALLTGCATEIQAKNQGVFQIDSISSVK